MKTFLVNLMAFSIWHMFTVPGLRKEFLTVVTQYWVLFIIFIITVVTEHMQELFVRVRAIDYTTCVILNLCHLYISQ